MLQLINYVCLARICTGHWPLGNSGYRSCSLQQSVWRNNFPRLKEADGSPPTFRPKENLPKDFGCCVCHPHVSSSRLFLLNTMLWLSCVLPVWLGLQLSANEQRSQYSEGCWVTIEGPRGLWAVMEEWITHLCDLCLSIFSACTQDQAAVGRCGRPLQALQLPQRGAGQAHLQVRLYGGLCGRPERRQSDPATGAEAPPLHRPEVTTAGTDACAHSGDNTEPCTDQSKKEGVKKALVLQSVCCFVMFSL